MATHRNINLSDPPKSAILVAFLLGAAGPVPAVGQITQGGAPVTNATKRKMSVVD